MAKQKKELEEKSESVENPNDFSILDDLLSENPQQSNEEESEEESEEARDKRIENDNLSNGFVKIGPGEYVDVIGQVKEKGFVFLYPHKELEYLELLEKKELSLKKTTSEISNDVIHVINKDGRRKRFTSVAWKNLGGDKNKDGWMRQAPTPLEISTL